MTGSKLMEIKTPMKRILVTGCCGSGKSTFSGKLAKATGLPLIHLDKHFWKPGWRPSSTEPWREIVRNLIQSDEWIIDGNYAGTFDLRMPRATTIINFDLSMYLCLFRCMKRTFFAGSTPRSDMAEGCVERYDLNFYKHVWNFPRISVPKFNKAIDEYFSGELITFSSDEEARVFLHKIDPPKKTS